MTVQLSCAAAILLVVINEVCSAGVFVTSGLPAGYIARSQTQEVPGLYHLCYGAVHPSLGATYYMYCSDKHECCYTPGGYPACCVERSSLNQAEVAGIVIGCSVFMGTLIGLSIYCSYKCCSDRSSY